MRSKVIKKMLAEVPAETRIFTQKYGDLLVRIHEILEEKGWSQKQLAKNLDKVPSEVSKWLSGEHNLTLRTIAKLEAELGEPLLLVPSRKKARKTSQVWEKGKLGTMNTELPGLQPSGASDVLFKVQQHHQSSYNICCND